MATVLDIGFGKGEWLELLEYNGIKVQGIELDSSMVKACKKHDLNVKQGDGVEYLKKQTNESFSIISAFHVIEYISFKDLQILVEEAHRVLQPGGILIIETPNFENLKVAIENFSDNPAHIKLIPPVLLSFLPDFHGYARTAALRLQKSEAPECQEGTILQQAIEGAGSDYSIVSQKEADERILKQFDKAFEEDLDLSLDPLSTKSENNIGEVEAKMRSIQQDYQLVTKSISWKITEPLCWVNHQ